MPHTVSRVGLLISSHGRACRTHAGFVQLILATLTTARPDRSFRAEQADAFSSRSLLYTLSPRKREKGERVGLRSRGIPLRSVAQATTLKQ